MTFEELPKDIQSWLGSKELGETLTQLENEYGLQAQFTVLPKAVFRLTSKQLQPQDLTAVLVTELSIGEKMVPLLKDIKQSVLMPIKEPLLKWGVDIDLINLSPAPRGQDEKTPPPLATPQFPKRETVSGPALKSSEPFILHAEEEMKTASSQTSRRDLTRPSFYKPETAERIDSSEPVTARIETEGLSRDFRKPGGALTARTTAPEPRVVHYSDLKTTLDPFAKGAPPQPKEDKKREVHPDNIINLKDLPQ